MNDSSFSAPTLVRHIEAGQDCCNTTWEDAYRRFETPEQEIEKFKSRLVDFGVASLPKDSQVLELFCGRGNSLMALHQLGFHNLSGVDLSEKLLQQYRGPGTLHLADCLNLPFDESSFDIIVIQGGLHHLPVLPDHLDQALNQAKRTLRDNGKLFVVEPWMTPFLWLVHAITDRWIVRKLYPKGDALATMTEEEHETYYQWLGQPKTLLSVFEKHFELDYRISFGKLRLQGTPRKS